MRGWRTQPGAWLAVLRGRGQRALGAALPDETSGVAMALLLGEGSTMTSADWEKYVRIDRAYLRPAEVDTLLGDSTKARESLGWRPTVSFPQLVQLMVEADLKAEGLDADKAMKRASVSR